MALKHWFAQVAQYRWWLILTALLGAVMLTLVVKLQPVLHPPVEGLARAPASCDLRQRACIARFPAGGQVQLAIKPSGIPLLTPLQLEVQLKALQAPQRVEIDFTGVDMEMGYNRVVLQATTEPGQYQGTGILPVCVRQRMLWEARVLLWGAEGLQAAAFRFITQRLR